MYVQLRLYAAHDYDLLALEALPYVNVTTIMHNCVCNYIRGKNEPIPLPNDFDPNVEIKDKRLTLTFNDDTEKDVVEWLKTVRQGFLNSAVKNITRTFINPEYLYNLYTTDNPELQIAGQFDSVKRKKRTSNKNKARNFDVRPLQFRNNTHSNETEKNQSQAREIKQEQYIQKETNTFSPNSTNNSDTSNNNLQNNIAEIQSQNISNQQNVKKEQQNTPISEKNIDNTPKFNSSSFDDLEDMFDGQLL